MGSVAIEQKLGTDLREKSLGNGRLLYWEYAERVKQAMKWQYPSLAYLHNQFHRKALIICGGGPSLNDDIPKIRELKRQGGYVLTVNKTHDHFMGLDEPIIPDFHVILDPMPWVAEYTKKVNRHTKYLIASSCTASVSRRIHLKGGKVFIWHAGADFYGEAMPSPILAKEFMHKPWAVIVGPTTVGLRSVVLGYELGFRPFHLFGMDSSSAANDSGQHAFHAYAKEPPKDAEYGTVTLHSRAGAFPFHTNSHMARQALDFEDLIEQIGDHVKNRSWEPVNIVVYGTGLLPAYAASIGLHGDPLMNQKYGVAA